MTKNVDSVARLTIAEVCARTGLGREWVHKAILQGKLAATKGPRRDGRKGEQWTVDVLECDVWRKEVEARKLSQTQFTGTLSELRGLELYIAGATPEQKANLQSLITTAK